MSKQVIEKMKKIVAAQTVKSDGYKGEFCSLVLVDCEGYPTASVLTAAKSDGIKHIWFGVIRDGNKAVRAAANKKASVHFGTAEHSVTLVGEVEILDDVETKKDIWYDGLAPHFPEGVTDPNYCVLKFTTKRWNAFVDWTDNEGVL